MSDLFLSFRFVATYLVPSAYPAMIALAGIILGTAIPYEHVEGVGPANAWMMNLLAWVGVATLLATFALVMKKLFGRQPSLNEILSGLVTIGSLNEYKEEQRLRAVGLEKQISDVRHSVSDRLDKDLVRYDETFREIFKRAEERDRVMVEMRDQVSRLQERTESHIRKIDQYDTKMDNLLREVSAAAALLKGATQR